MDSFTMWGYFYTGMFVSGFLSLLVNETLHRKRFLKEELARYTEYYLNPKDADGKPRFPLNVREWHSIFYGLVRFYHNTLKKELVNTNNL